MIKRDMHNLPIVETENLILNGVYFNRNSEIIQIKNINNIKKELVLLNISGNYTHYVKFNMHDLVKRIR